MNKLRIGMIGCGGMSRHHGRMITQQTPDAEIVALCDTHDANLDRYQREIFDPINQKPPRYHDYREMLDKVELDGVIIVTPHLHHYEQTMASLDAGCHVLLEKPMVVSSEHARTVIQKAAAVRRTISVAFPGPFSPEFAYITQLMDSGALGQPVMIQGMVTQQWKKATAGTWRQDPKLSGGGQAYDSGAHMFNALLYLTRQRPVEVFAWTDNRGAPVDITATVSIRFENGTLGSAAVGGDDVAFLENVYLSCEKGSVRTGIYGGRLEMWDANHKPVRYPPVPAVPTMHENFVACIRGTAKSPCPPIWGLRQSLLMEAIYESARTGQSVTVKPE